MATLPELEIAIGADITEIKRALQSLTKDIQTVKNTAAKPGRFNFDFEGARKGFSGLLGQVKALVGAYAGLQGASALARIADEANVLQARLKLATKSQEEFNAAQQATFGIAQRTQTSLGTTINLYSKLERSTRDLGINQATLLQLTETINQAGLISGGGQAVENALEQLSQGLSEGALRGDEFVSVMSGAPRVAQAIADGFVNVDGSIGVSIGSLRKLAAEGKLTTEQIGRALLSQRGIVADEAGELGNTIAGAFTRLRNALVVFVRDADDATSVSGKIAAAINKLADNLPEVIEYVIDFAKAWAAYVVVFKVVPGIIGSVISVFGGLVRAFGFAKIAFTGVLGVLKLIPTAMLRLIGPIAALLTIKTIGKVLYDQFDLVKLGANFMVEGVLVAFENLKRGLRKAEAAVRIAAEDIWKAITFQDREFAPAKLDAAFAKIDEESDAAVQAIRDNFLSAYDDIDSRGAQSAKKAADNAKGALDSLKGQDIGIPDSGPIDDGKNKFNANLRAAADENALILDNIDRALNELENRYDDNLVSLNAYYAERTRLQNAALDAEIASKQQELAALKAEEQELRAEGKDNTSNVEAQSRAMTELVELSRQRGDIASAAAREQAAAERELADQLIDVKARLAEATGQTAEARRQQIEAEFAELRTNLQLAGDTAGLALVDRLINVEAAKANLDELEGEISGTLDNLRAQEDNITAQIDAGLIGQFRGEEQLQTLREKSIEQLKRYKAELQAAYAAAKDPAIQAEISKRITELDTEIARVTASTQVLQNQLRDIGQNGLEQFFNDVMAGTKSIGDAFRGLILQIAKDIGALAAKNVAGAITGQLSGAFGGGGGGGGFDFGSLFSKAGSFLSSFFHRGGIVGQGAPMQRMVPAWAFAGAPRYHSGGMAGLKPDEVPAVLQKGEEVLAKNDSRNAANGGQGNAFRVVNVLDPRMAGDYLESSEGERVIMNIIGRNPGQVRQLLG